MPDLSDFASRNLLLQAMPQEDRAALQAVFEPVLLTRRLVLAAPDEPVEYVYFPEEGVSSIVATTGDHRRLEVGLYGREGMSAPSLLLGVDRTPHEHFIQIEGSGFRVSARNLLRLAGERAGLRSVLLRYAQAFNVQTAQTALANGAYNVQERLARWLLMCDDRVDGAELPLTHEFLGLMLGVRRSSVTVTLHILEAAGIIKSTRARVVVLDRAKLEAAAGESYGVAEAEYARLFGTPPT